MPWEKCFCGKSVTVTGAGRGIGRAISLELHRNGAKVWAISKNPDNLKSLKEECPSIQTIAVDLSDWDATREAIEKIEAVDMLVNNAGIVSVQSFFEITQQNFDALCNVNLKAVINVSQIVAKKMIDSGKAGSIVNVSSVAGLKVFTNISAYCILKAGLDHLTKIMALELGPKNIRVNSVNPGDVDTDMMTQLQEAQLLANLNPEKRRLVDRIPSTKKIVAMKDVVNSVLFLLSDSAPMITGTNLAIEGGYSIS